MFTPDSKLKAAIAAKQAGRYEDALQVACTVFGEIASGVPGAAELYPFTMSFLQQLSAVHPPTIETLGIIRGYHAELLMGGDATFAGSGSQQQVSRFQLIVHIDQMFGNSQGTLAVFKQLMAAQPALANREAHLALPAIIHAGDFKLAEQCQGDPMARLKELNSMSVLYPLLPADKPPRLAAELLNFINDVQMRAAILRGLGRDAEAEAVLARISTGIVPRDMRELAERELAEPGTIAQVMADLMKQHHLQRSAG